MTEQGALQFAAFCQSQFDPEIVAVFCALRLDLSVDGRHSLIA
jgi:hypothetical protein